MLRRLAWVALAAAFATPVHAVSPLGSATLPLPTEFDTLYAAFLTRTTGGPALSAEALQLLRTLHIQYTLRLQADGKAVAAGGFTDGEGPIGMVLLCAEDLAAARALAEADPAVQFGQMTVDVRSWSVPAGRVRCGTPGRP